MSTWTHVAAIVRVEGLCMTEDQSRPDWDAIFGKECLFDAPSKVWDDAIKYPDKYLPMGSEGSLRKTACMNPDPSCADAYTISIFGDLKDYNAPSLVIDWFKKVVKSDYIIVRQACITVSNGCSSMVWGYNFGAESRASNRF